MRNKVKKIILISFIIFIGAIIVHEVGLNITAYSNQKTVEHYLVNEKKAKIKKMNRDVGLIEEEIDINVFFEDEPKHEYKFFVDNGKVYQSSIECHGDGCNPIGLKKYADE